MSNFKVMGYCPMGCGQTLFLAAGGYITCSFIHCPRPTAVTDLLEDDETEHIVKLDEPTFLVRHPLSERLDDVMSCTIHDRIAGLDGPPRKPGTYRVCAEKEPWMWIEVQP